MVLPLQRYVTVPEDSYLEVLQSRYGDSFQWLNAEEKLALLKFVILQIEEVQIQAKGQEAVTEGEKFCISIANKIRETVPRSSLLGLAEALINQLKELI
jgi:hypothetical protein